MAFPVVRACVTVVGLVQNSFLCARVSGYCCNLCVCCYMWSEFYCALWLGHLDQFSECFNVFSHPPLPFTIITLLLLSLLLLLLLVITVIIISTKLLALCDGCLGWGWVWQAGLVAGLGVGKAFGVLLLPGIGVSSSSPQIPGHPTSICDAGVNH